MIDIKDQWHSLTDRQKWAARGTALVAKTKATKEVWLPPKPVEAGSKAAATSKRTTKRTAKKAAGTAKKSASRSRSSNGTVKKATPKKSTTKKTSAGSRS